MAEAIWVTLTLAEMIQAAITGAMRHYESVTSKRKDAHGAAVESSLVNHILGAAGEIALAKITGKYWGGHVNTFKGSDLGAAVQIRTRSKHHYDLPVRKDDADDHAFILVTGQPPYLAIRGWIMGADAKKNPDWIQTYGKREPAWFVPQSELRPIFKEKVLAA